jgi:hypothetical protein
MYTNIFLQKFLHPLPNNYNQETLKTNSASPLQSNSGLLSTNWVLMATLYYWRDLDLLE